MTLFAVPRRSTVPIHPTFGAKLRWWRIDRGLSVRRLAADADLSWSLVAQLERHETNPSYASACQLSKALGIPVEYLWDHTSPPDHHPRGRLRV